MDFRHMRLQLTFTPEGLKARTCEGRVEYTLQPRAQTVQTVRLDAVGMRIIGAEAPRQNRQLAFAYDGKVLTIQLSKPLAPEQTLRLAVNYRLEAPRKGMYFVLPNVSVPTKPLMVYTMSEPLEARYWVPAHDWPNARWTSDIEVTVPDHYSVVANGTLVDRRRTRDGKGTTFHWRNKVPTDPHLMGLVVGQLVQQRDRWRDKPVFSYTQPGSEAAARFTFRHTPEMLEFYTRLIGYDFPYPSYSHVTVADHHHGGMEHAGFSMVSPLYIADRDEGDWPVERTENWLLAHMLAHEWFGGVVNYRSVSEAWLNESFATYLDTLWASHREMPDRLEYEMWLKARGVAAADSSESGKPLVYRDVTDVAEVYHMDGQKVYYKGAWLVHMLQHRLGPDIFWRGVRQYLRENEWQSVETSDLRQALEKVSGRDLEQFFQLWVYGHGVPRLEVNYCWDATNRQAKVEVRQTQDISASTPAFACPLDLTFRVAGRETNVTVQLRDARHEFGFEFAAEPTVFCVDPHEVLLKTLVVREPHGMLVEQARRGPTALSRMLAVEGIGHADHAADLPTLQQVLQDSSEFWAVRQAAAQAIGRRRSEPALRALLEADRVGIANSRVLTAVVEALGRFVESPAAHGLVLRYADPKQPLNVETAAVEALGRMRASPELTARAVKVVLAAAQKPSRRGVRYAAFESLRALEDPNTIAIVLELAQPARNDELRVRAISLLGRLGRLDGARERTRTALSAWLYDPDRAVQLAVIRTLGELGDPGSLPDLERLRNDARSQDVRAAADAAIGGIRRN